MEPDELVLSDVHVHLDRTNLEMYEAQFMSVKVVRSRFLFREKLNDSSFTKEVKRKLVDEDGDMDPIRRDEAHYGVILIDHCLATRFVDVGLQVWSACLLLCDFICDRSDIFETKNVLELGAGVGLCSLVSSKFSKNVICTDSSPEALKLCERNCSINGRAPNYHDNVTVRRLDWSEGINSHEWSCEDVKAFKSIDIIIASDVVFSDELTDAFIGCLMSIIGDGLKERVDVYVALEKRLNFTLEARDIACPAYSHFMQSMHGLLSENSKQSSSHRMKFSQVLDVGQYFLYDRSNYLELWHLEATKVQKLRE